MLLLGACSLPQGAVLSSEPVSPVASLAVSQTERSELPSATESETHSIHSVYCAADQTDTEDDDLDEVFVTTTTDIRVSEVGIDSENHYDTYPSELFEKPPRAALQA
jgi:hypothetical protein